MKTYTDAKQSFAPLAMENFLQNQIGKVLENGFENKKSSKINLTPTDVLNLSATQNTRDKTICKQRTDEKRFYINLQESKQSRLSKIRAPPEETQNFLKNNIQLKMISFKNNNKNFKIE